MGKKNIDKYQLDMFDETPKSNDGNKSVVNNAQKDIEKELNKDFSFFEKHNLSEDDFQDLFDVCADLSFRFGSDYVDQWNFNKDYLKTIEQKKPVFYANFQLLTNGIAKNFNQNQLKNYNIIYNFLNSFVMSMRNAYKNYKKDVGENVDLWKPDIDDFEVFRKGIINGDEKYKKHIDYVKNNMKGMYINFVAKGISSDFLIKEDSSKRNFFDVNSKPKTLYSEINSSANKKYFEELDKDDKKYGFKNLNVTNIEFGKFLSKIKESVDYMKIAAQKEQPQDKIPDSKKIKYDPNLFDYGSYDIEKIKELNKFLSMNFVFFNHGLRFSFHQIRFRKMQDLYLKKFYQLYLPEDKKYFDLVEGADQAFEKGDFQSARKLYYRARSFRPGDTRVNDMIKKVEELFNNEKL